MKVYKGCTGDLTSTWGKGVYRLQVGEKMTADASRCRSTGFHASEYAFECLDFYPLGSGNRYFLAEAEGDIDETDGNAHVACTEMTLVRELSVKGLAMAGLVYMVGHPQRDWEKEGYMLNVKKDRADMPHAGGIAIARGADPRVRGGAGAYLGLMVEREPGEILAAKLVEAGRDVEPGVWLRLDAATGKVVRADEA